MSSRPPPALPLPVPSYILQPLDPSRRDAQQNHASGSYQNQVRVVQQRPMPGGSCLRCQKRGVWCHTTATGNRKTCDPCAAQHSTCVPGTDTGNSGSSTGRYNPISQQARGRPKTSVTLGDLMLRIAALEEKIRILRRELEGIREGNKENANTSKNPIMLE
ncbi:hypothetical protein AMATHDRAFT_49392 [Amanita thiersii Skay4041]|uniref:Zn(2)-C6 fungal-type domain-containing protein n=1 Tax=Amanita thiersii Skay4041 TaxID=703135 RepID=A0A2A9NLP2_9AGAR|nr:hypothetical protein AMATHDRAFT_49392 [Amanita thiersii Skay4041]